MVETEDPGGDSELVDEAREEEAHAGGTQHLGRGADIIKFLKF